MPKTKRQFGQYKTVTPKSGASKRSSPCISSLQCGQTGSVRFASFENATFVSYNFRNAQVKYTEFNRAKPIYCDFSNAELRKADFTNTMVSHVDFRRPTGWEFLCRLASFCAGVLMEAIFVQSPPLVAFRLSLFALSSQAQTSRLTRRFSDN